MARGGHRWERHVSERHVARAGAEDRVAELLGELVVETRTEPGNLEYLPHRDPADPRVFLMYEAYTDAESGSNALSEDDATGDTAADDDAGTSPERIRAPA